MPVKISYQVSSTMIVCNFNGSTKWVKKEDQRYEKILELIREGKAEEIPQLFEEPKVELPEGLTIVDGVYQVNGEALPSELSKKVDEYLKNKLPIITLLNFWTRLKRNGSYNSRKALYLFLEKNAHPITEDGKFIAYRSIRKDWKDHHTGTMDNSLGQVVTEDRALVDDNPNNTCSRGLHVASFAYASKFHSGRSSRLVEVIVDPEHVVCVPTDYNNTKMRVCQFTVLQEVTEESLDLYRQANGINNTPADNEDYDDQDYQDDQDDDYQRYL